MLLLAWALAVGCAKQVPDPSPLIKGCPQGSRLTFIPNEARPDLLPGQYVCAPMVAKLAPEAK
jgi:hypothetical protein